MHLELRSITKRFGAFVANDAVDLVVEPGQIHCLVGENGAGKSTLMNVLFGLLQPDEGRILLDGKELTLHGPADAVRAGIGMVHQHFMLIPVLTVAENIALGHEPTKALGFLDLEKARQTVRELSTTLGMPVDPDALVEDLPVGVQQRVEIMKALSRKVHVLVLDEPTAVLTPQETDELLDMIQELAATGTSIVLITHKLREVKKVANAITVLRRGKVVACPPPTTSREDLAALMVGREVNLTMTKEQPPGERPVLVCRGVSVRDSRGIVQVDNLTLTVNAGSIVALAGVQGNGQSELTEAIMGLIPLESGEIFVDGEPIHGTSTRVIREKGVGYVPEDRSHDGVIGSLTVAENLALTQYYRPPLARGWSLPPSNVHQHATTLAEDFDVRTQSVAAPMSSLSGGNQQKAVLAREMTKTLKVLVVCQPTRGVDVGSIESLHRRIVAERDAGTAVLLVSSELDEVLSLADRIAVMYRGSVIAEVPGSTSREDLGALMAGVVPEEGQG